VVDALEITQAIQDFNHSVPLVAHKRTFVRFYVRSTTPGGPYWATAVLRVQRGSQVTEVWPINPGGGINVDWFWYRGLRDTAFLFELPTEYTYGTVQLTAEVNPEHWRTVQETNYLDNSSPVWTAFFSYKAPLCVVMVPVRTDPTTAYWGPGYQPIVDWLKAAYPVPDVWVYSLGEPVEELEVCWAGPFPYPCFGPYEMPDDGGWVLHSLWWRNLLTDDPGECGDHAHYFGMVDASHGERGGAGYIWWVGSPPWDEAWGFMNLTDAGTGLAWYSPHGGATLAHEIGHNYGRHHVDCPPGKPANPDHGYPYDECTLGPLRQDAYYGFNSRTLEVIWPNLTADLMSYEKPRWPSDYTYKALYNALPGAAARSPAAATALAQEVVRAQEVLAVTGFITPTEGTATLDYAYRLSQGLVSTRKLTKLASRIQPSTAATYSLRLLDAADGVLREQPFDLPPDDHPAGEARSFNMLMPYDPATAFIVLYEGDTELTRRSVSQSPPSVQVLSPNGGENITGSMTVQWLADDPDGDPLLYTVQYSRNAGDEWQTLVSNYYTQTLVVDHVPGSDAALVRVIATDGVNTADDESDAPFTASNHVPEVEITSPSDGMMVATDQTLNLQAYAYDIDTGTMQEDQLEWHSSMDGFLGNGSQLTITGLSEGDHTITFRADDGESGVATDTVQVTVVSDISQLRQPRAFLPLLLKQWTAGPTPTPTTTPPALDTLVPVGATWKYLDDGSDQGMAWSSPSFDDSSWAWGPAELGYGDGDETTVVDYGPDPEDKHITTYFRHAFTVDDASAYAGLRLRLLRDDGAVVYLNGAEVFRSNMPGGTVDSQTLASACVWESDEEVFWEVVTGSEHLASGSNVIAVEVHQCDPGSSDISFDLELSRSPAQPVDVSLHDEQACIPSGSAVRLTTQWYVDTVAYAEDYLDSLELSVLVDGAALSQVADYWGATEACGDLDEDGDTDYVVRWAYPIGSLADGAHTVESYFSLAYPITDGFDLDEDGVPDVYSGSWERFLQITVGE
jgi:hypothetical protein